MYTLAAVMVMACRMSGLNMLEDVNPVLERVVLSFFLTAKRTEFLTFQPTRKESSLFLCFYGSLEGFHFVFA
jgi:hypothetical protein